MGRHCTGPQAFGTERHRKMFLRTIPSLNELHSKKLDPPAKATASLSKQLSVPGGRANPGGGEPGCVDSVGMLNKTPRNHVPLLALGVKACWIAGLALVAQRIVSGSSCQLQADAHMGPSRQSQARCAPHSRSLTPLLSAVVVMHCPLQVPNLKGSPTKTQTSHTSSLKYWHLHLPRVTQASAGQSSEST